MKPVRELEKGSGGGGEGVGLCGSRFPDDIIVFCILGLALVLTGWLWLFSSGTLL